MIDVFVSYARQDKSTAQQLAQALEQKGFTVWWDQDLLGGENFRDKIREAIGGAAKVVVLWSARSVESGFVIDEANEAKRQGKLVPVSIDGTAPPFGFGNLHVIFARDVITDLDQIIAALKGFAVPNGSPPSRPLLQTQRMLTALAIVAVAGAALIYWLQPLNRSEQVDPRDAEAWHDVARHTETAAEPVHPAPQPKPETAQTTAASPPPDIARACVVTDPTGSPLNVRAEPQGEAVGTLPNNLLVWIAGVKDDYKGQPWALITGNSGQKIGWVFRKFITCPEN